MDGVFNVLKPPGMTSHDVVAYLRRILETKRIGHGGTLDPDAAGVLPVFVGSATRLLEYAVEGTKEYIAEFRLGIKTDTGDDSGQVIKASIVPNLNADIFKKLFKQFIGPQMQTPPMYSAIKIKGQKLYQLARKGLTVERVPRPIEIFRIELLYFTANSFTIAVECSKGTYIRVLGEDLAEALGTSATLSFLLRTRVGAYTISCANSLQEIMRDPLACKQSPLLAVTNLPKIRLNGKQAMRITNGVPTTVMGYRDGRYVLLGPCEEFLGIALCQRDKIRAEKILQRYQISEYNFRG